MRGTRAACAAWTTAAVPCTCTAAYVCEPRSRLIPAQWTTASHPVNARVSAASSPISARDPGCVTAGGNRRDIGMSSDEHDIVAVGEQRTRGVTPDKATRARDRDPGHSIATVVAGRRRGWARLPRSWSIHGAASTSVVISALEPLLSPPRMRATISRPM